MKNVAISISLHHSSSRDFLSGVFRYLESQAEWNPKICQREESFMTLEELIKANADAIDGIILTEVESKAVADAIRKTKIPVVTVGFRNRALERRGAPTTAIRCDNTSIGVLGAKYLCGLGCFNSFGFVQPEDSSVWADERMSAFSEEMSRRGNDVKTFRIKHGTKTDRDIHGLEKWVCSLTKPTAIMAACDRCAIPVLTACEQAGLKIPRQVSVIGVDNDEFICQHATPSLSSIMPGHGELGQFAARTLDRMMSRRRKGATRSRAVVVAHISSRMIERESSKPIPPASLLVDRAKRFIRENACGGIGVDDVADHLGVSRRLLEIRVRELEGSTVRNLIEDVRLAALKHQLSTTARPVGVIARECGYSDAHVLAHLFKKRFGISMRDYRAQTRAR